jgi:hypothetical protein
MINAMSLPNHPSGLPACLAILIDLRIKIFILMGRKTPCFFMCIANSDHPISQDLHGSEVSAPPD